MFEPASVKTLATDRTVPPDVISKPKSPRKPRVKPEPITLVVRERKQVVRLPKGWQQRSSCFEPLPEREPAESPAQAIAANGIQSRKAVRLPEGWSRQHHGRIVIEPPARKRATRLPPAWATLIRASQYQPILVEPRAVLAEANRDAVMNTKRIVEAILFAANRPMTIKQIQETFPELEQPDTLTVQMALEDIARDYADRPVGLKQLASGYRFQIREGMSPWVTRLFEERPARYSRALMETLAIIAYRQPVTRGEIEDIRGVAVSTSIVQTMLEREWIRVIGHKEVPGRPALYGTTKQFLDYFNLTSLNELPTLQDIVDMDFGAAVQPPPQQELRERSQTATTETADDVEQAAVAQIETRLEASGEASSQDGEPRILH